MKQITDSVSVKYKTAEGKEAEEISPVSYPEFETSDDVLEYLSKGDKDAISHFIGSVNYGLNLKARAKVRTSILDKVAGPDKAINKMVETLVKGMAALGIPFTEEQARAQIKANQDAAAAAKA